MLNLLETIPSSNKNESKDVKSIKVVTRAQALKDATQQSDGKEKSKKSSLSTWKARRQRRLAAKKRREEKALDEQKSQEGKSTPQGGSMLADKVFEPLDRKSTRLNSSHSGESRMPSSA